MELLRVSDGEQAMFAAAPEAAMDLHIAQTVNGQPYLVIGCRVAISLESGNMAEPDSRYLSQGWLAPDIPGWERENAFVLWLAGLSPAPKLALTAMGPVVPIAPLAPPPARPTFIYGHLPFRATTVAQTVIYRWEAFPTSRRINVGANPGAIAQDTYAAPESELPFVTTGFGAVARFALPNLMPACFRYELRPVAGTILECGAAVPLYGQSGGGVEVKFTSNTNNQGMIAPPTPVAAL